MTGFDTVSFLSDFGHADEFVGVVKSVIRDIAPHATVIDIGHEVPPFDVRAGSLALVRAVQYLASGVVLGIVDPGVGSARRAVAVQAAEGRAVFLGPDNGLLAPAVAMVGGAERAVQLTNLEYQLPAPGPTFAGRDVFAPAAAHLCNGVDLSELGPYVDPFSLTPGLVPLPRDEDGTLVCDVLWVDRFGNCQLNVSPEETAAFGERVTVRSGDSARVATVAGTYADLAPGQLGLVVDSYGLCSLVLDRASAADELGLQAGDGLTLQAPA